MAEVCFHVYKCLYVENKNALDSGLSKCISQVSLFLCACLPMRARTLRVCLCN